MDEGFSAAVLKVFVELHRQGLLYRDKRLVNWDPGLGTAISDLEVETREVQGKFWHLTYPLADGSGTISVATTRPETMLADMAVAVNPADERYTALVGRMVRLPITGRLIPIVADDHADPALGSGAVKITPGHDFNDFEVGRRAGIEARDMLNMLGARGEIVQTADGLIPDELIGLDRADARKRIVALLEEAGALARIEDRVIQTPYGDRSGVVIEPWLTDQWYVDARTLAQPAIEAVRKGDIALVPKSWEKTFFNWMENIQPWCVSRQLWWGHQIPAWFDGEGKAYVAETEEEAQALAGADVALVRDPDVLDTWFSSALWPFATLGWPNDGDPTLGGRYPNDVLISGFDILFFWNARMMMQGMHFLKEVPFRKLYLHGLVRAADGAKMSKSKGNTVDPLGLIDAYGADALRFFMAAMESQGRDIKMDEKRVEGYRNFATKLWNAARFAQGNGIGGSSTLEPPVATHAVNQWIIAECVATVQAVDLALAELRFDAAANAIYQFVWSRFCDWYLELIKGQVDDETRAVAGWTLDQILALLHPFMPFITEELWHGLAARDHDLIVGHWPQPDARSLDPEASREIDWLIRLVSEIRAARTELNVPPGARLPLHVRDAGEGTNARLTRQAASLARLARVDLVAADAQEPSGGAAQVVVDEATFVLPLAGVIDLEAERARLTKAIAAAEKERDALAARLGNASFVERAKPEAVEKARADHADKTAEASRLQAALTRLG
jgi:valyl-tRNA synthetase